MVAIDLTWCPSASERVAGIMKMTAQGIAERVQRAQKLQVGTTVA
jgi:hypothetical protein